MPSNVNNKKNWCTRTKHSKCKSQTLKNKYTKSKVSVGILRSREESGILEEGVELFFGGTDYERLDRKPEALHSGKEGDSLGGGGCEMGLGAGFPHFHQGLHDYVVGVGRWGDVGGSSVGRAGWWTDARVELGRGVAGGRWAGRSGAGRRDGAGVVGGVRGEL